MVSAADARGWLVHVHAIGDRAVREALNGMQQARRDRDSGIAHSITHPQLVNPANSSAFRPLGVIASMQLYWAAADETTVDLMKPYISAFAYRYQYPAHSLLSKGATIAGASDWPVSSLSPWKAIQQAVTRKARRACSMPANAWTARPCSTPTTAKRCADHRPGAPDRQPGAGQAGGLHRP
ncbi:amidohydrolase family protein [Pseudomonas aeruginosa]|nr:amidohydrolase family protein [Pseudomonas aeruginosa]